MFYQMDVYMTIFFFPIFLYIIYNTLFGLINHNKVVFVVLL